jgi:hypothetical protein
MSSDTPESPLLPFDMQFYCDQECPVQCTLIYEETMARTQYSATSMMIASEILPDDGVLGVIADLVRESGVSEEQVVEMKKGTKAEAADMLATIDKKAREIDEKRQKLARSCGQPLVMEGVANSQRYRVMVCTAADAYPAGEDHADVHLWRSFEL